LTYNNGTLASGNVGVAGTWNLGGATGADAGSVTYEITSTTLPGTAGIDYTFNATTGALTWEPASGENGAYTIVVKASGTIGVAPVSVTATWTLTINL
jgi:hypothetical protein